MREQLLERPAAARPAATRPAGATADAALPALANERRIKLFGLEITDTDIASAATWIVRRARHRLPTSIAFLNAHCVNVMHRDAAYRVALTRMTRIFADGIGVRMAARACGHDLQDNVNGTDLFPVLCNEMAPLGVGLYLFGAAPGVADACARNMVTRTPGLVICGTQHGYVTSTDAESEAIARMNASGADIVLVALGVPAQEAWIDRNRARIAAPVVIGVGGLFDYYSGRIERAPVAFRNAGLEWAWRLAQEPRRLAHRYLLGNIEFLARLALSRVR